MQFPSKLFSFPSPIGWVFASVRRMSKDKEIVKEEKFSYIYIYVENKESKDGGEKIKSYQRLYNIVFGPIIENWNIKLFEDTFPGRNPN